MLLQQIHLDGKPWQRPAILDILGHVGPAAGPQDLMSLPSLDGSPPQPSEARPWLQDGAVNFFSDILKSYYVGLFENVGLIFPMKKPFNRDNDQQNHWV